MTESVYTVTPPDLRTTVFGPSITMLGVPFDKSEPYVKLFDNLFSDSDVTIYTSEVGLNETNVAWFRAVVGMSNIVIVDIDYITSEELVLALHAEMDNSVLVFWITSEHKNQNIQKLLNSYNYSVFTTVDQISEFLEAEYTHKIG